MLKSSDILIYTDGSSLGNPGPGGFGVVIIFSEKEVFELGGYEKHTTNNRMELSAAIYALDFLTKNFKTLELQNLKLSIHTDSAYVLNGITSWVFGWQKNNWQTSTKTEVLNKDLWQELVELTRKFPNINWVKVKGHSGVDLNERCDVIATSFASEEKIDLFKGSMLEYKSLIHNHTPRKVGSKVSKSKGGIYVSLIDGLAQIHTTWADCENRVKGVGGAKYKKVSTRNEAEEIINSWISK